MWIKKKENKFKEEFVKRLKREDIKFEDEKLSLELARTYADTWASLLGNVSDEDVQTIENAIVNFVKHDWSENAEVIFYRSDKKIIAIDSDGKSMELISGELSLQEAVIKNKKSEGA